MRKRPAKGTGSGGMMIAGVILAGGQGVRLGGADKALTLLAGTPLLAHVAARFGPQVGDMAISANGDPARLVRFGWPVLADAPRTAPAPASDAPAAADAGPAPADRTAHEDQRHPGKGDGPLAGILCGLDWAARPDIGATHLATVAVDTPFLPCDLVVRLMACLVTADGNRTGSMSAAIAESRGQSHPTCALWPVACAPLLRAWLSGQHRRSIRAFAATLGVVRVAFDVTSSGNSVLGAGSSDRTGTDWAGTNRAGTDRTSPDPFFNINTPDDLVRATAMLAGAGS